MANQPTPVSLYGRSDSVFIFVASLIDGATVCDILLRVLSDLCAQALQAAGIEHVGIVHAFGEAAKSAVREAQKRLPLLQRAEVRRSYVFDIDADSIDANNPPRFVVLVVCKRCATRKAARRIVQTILERGGVEGTPVGDMPVLIVETHAEPQQKHAAKAAVLPSTETCRIVLAEDAASTVRHLLQLKMTEKASVVSKTRLVKRRERGTA